MSHDTHMTTYLVLEVLAVWSHGDNHSSNLVNLTVKPARGYELRQLSINELNRHPKGGGHVRERQRAIGLQQLSVCLDPHLTDVVPRVSC